jgi:PAS domain S-box-containing protein
MLRLTGMDSGGMYLFSTDGQSLDLIYHQGLGAEFIQAVAHFPIDSPNAQVILTGKPFYFRHDHPVTQSPLYRAEGLRSAAAIPILYRDRVIGCFNLASHTENEVRPLARQALEPLSLEVGNFVVHLQAQTAVRASEEKFRELADTINEVFWVFDNRQQKLVYLNPAYERVWGISIADTYHDSRKYIEAIHPDDRPILFAALARQAKGEQTEMEYRIVRPDGAVRWIFDRSFPILGEAGQVRRTTGVATDITALKQSRQELQELNRLLEERVAERTTEVQDLYDNAPAGYHSLDANGCLLRINQTELNPRPTSSGSSRYLSTCSATPSNSRPKAGMCALASQ